MSPRADALESRLFRRYWDDGLLDLFAGVGVVAIGIFWAFDFVALGAVVPAILASLWVPLRRALVEPRAGLVEFSDGRTGRMQRLGWGSVVFGLAMLALFVSLVVLNGWRPVALLSSLTPGLPAFLLALPSALVGWGLGLPRFHAYAAILCIGGLVVALADTRPELAMLAGGIVVLASGAWRLQRFLRIPVENAEAD